MWVVMYVYQVPRYPWRSASSVLSYGQNWGQPSSSPSLGIISKLYCKQLLPYQFSFSPLTSLPSLPSCLPPSCIKECRGRLLEALDKLSAPPSEDLVEKVASCHLRPGGSLWSNEMWGFALLLYLAPYLTQCKNVHWVTCYLEHILWQPCSRLPTTYGHVTVVAWEWDCWDETLMVWEWDCNGPGLRL